MKHYELKIKKSFFIKAYLTMSIFFNFLVSTSALASPIANNQFQDPVNNLSPALKAFVEKNATPSIGQGPTCTIIIQKSPAWANYTVNISLHDFLTQRPLMTFHLPAATAKTPSVNMASANFNCARYSVVQFFATFSPPIWIQEKNQVYSSKVIWNITEQVQALKPGEMEIQVEVNFPDDFIHVPSLIDPRLLH